jgi:uncharacterized protein YndB with AHSA1/START domain
MHAHPPAPSLSARASRKGRLGVCLDGHLEWQHSLLELREAAQRVHEVLLEGEGGETITTVTFEETGGTTLLVVHDRYPSKEALDDAIASGSTSGMPEALDQLDELLVTLGASERRS